jgi:hypothetical protein
MALSGLFSLNKNGAPDCNTLKFTVPPGYQKFMSSGLMPLRCLNQLLSVTPK